MHAGPHKRCVLGASSFWALFAALAGGRAIVLTADWPDSGRKGDSAGPSQCPGQSLGAKKCEKYSFGSPLFFCIPWLFQWPCQQMQAPPKAEKGDLSPSTELPVTFFGLGCRKKEEGGGAQVVTRKQTNKTKATKTSENGDKFLENKRGEIHTCEGTEEGGTIARSGTATSTLTPRGLAALTLVS